MRWVPLVLAISRASTKTLSESLFLPLSCLLTTWLPGGNCVREVWGHQAGISCPCETGGKCAASARCGSASKSFLTACSCQTHPCHLALHSMSKARAVGSGQHPRVSQILTEPGLISPERADQTSHRALIPPSKTLVCYPCNPCTEQCHSPGTIPEEAGMAGEGEPLFVFPSPACSAPS